MSARKKIAWALWIGIGIDVVLALLLDRAASRVSIGIGDVLALLNGGTTPLREWLRLTLWLLGALGVMVAGLLCCYPHRQSDWRVWAALLTLCVLGGLVTQRVIAMPLPAAQLLGALTFFASGVALVTLLLILSWRYDLSLAVAAGLSLAVIWTIVFAWRAMGDITRFLFTFVLTGEPIALWWIGGLITASLLLIPLLVVVAVLQMVMFIVCEVRNKNPLLDRTRGYGRAQRKEAK